MTIAFPVPNIPIRDRIVNSVRELIASLGIECEIKETIMNPEEREAFLNKEQKNWRRLGHSLGINNIPPKICTYSCVYPVRNWIHNKKMNFQNGRENLSYISNGVY